jgi:O-antigen/teichoic acid export membrane protein
MASTLITAMFGFVFWIMNARLFRPEQVGVATIILSATTLITQFSLLGLKNGIIRYLPHSSEKDIQINTGSNIIILFTAALSILYILFVPFFSSKLLFLHDNFLYAFLFVIFVISFTLNQLQEGIFIAYRSTGYVFIKNALWGAFKVALPLFLISFGAYGIFFAASFGSVMSFLLGFYYLVAKFRYKVSPRIDMGVVKQIGKFSFGDYLGIFFAELPYFVIPLIIINNIGPRDSAYYYISLQISALLYVIPAATTQSLFAEGTNDVESLKHHLRKAFLLILILLIPAILITIFLGGFVLKIFGDLYAENGLRFLQLLAAAGVFVAINNIGSAIVHIKKRIHYYVWLSFISAGLMILFSIIFLPYHLVGIGYAWLIGQGVSAIIYLFLLRRILR